MNEEREDVLESENWKRKTLMKRLEEIGFYVHQLGKDFLSSDIFTGYGLSGTVILYALTKQQKEIKN